jgi:hypothetical protein
MNITKQKHTNSIWCGWCGKFTRNNFKPRFYAIIRDLKQWDEKCSVCYKVFKKSDPVEYKIALLFYSWSVRRTVKLGDRIVLF